jgi:hypothetical protein
LFFGFLFGWNREKFESGKNQKGRRTDPMRKTKKQKRKTHQGRADFLEFSSWHVFLGGF